MVYSYLVVEFLGDQSVREISETWIFKSSDGHLKAHWPPFSTDRETNKAIMNHTSPAANWGIYSVRKLGGKYDDYLIARNKAKAAEKLSDINTEEEDQHGRTKRRRIRSNVAGCNRSDDSSCGEDASNETSSLPKLPSFPSSSNTPHSLPSPSSYPSTEYMPPRRSPRKHKPKTSASTPYDNSFNLDDFSPTNNFQSRPSAVSQVDINDMNLQLSPPSTYTDLSNSSPLANKPIFSSLCSEQNSTPYIHHTPYTLPNNHTPLNPSRPNHQTTRIQCKSCKDHDKNYNQILRKLTELKATQHQQQETLDILLNLQERQGQSNIDRPRPHIQPTHDDDYMSDLPLKSIEELAAFEKKLADEPDFKSDLSRQLSLIGGATPSDAVKRMLRKLMTDAVGSHYSFVGFKKKMRFDKLVLKDVLFNAVRLNFHTKNTTEKDMEVAVKKWLQHAKSRAEHGNAL